MAKRTNATKLESRLVNEPFIRLKESDQIIETIIKYAIRILV